MDNLDPKRAVAEMKALRELTSDENGNQRIAFSDVWLEAIDFFRRKATEIGLACSRDEAGNQWAVLEGESPEYLCIGGHLDSVYNGGWLDGCWNVIAGLEAMRHLKARGRLPFTVKLVSWCDEEGARFGRSLFGSSAWSGTLKLSDLRGLKDRDGTAIEDAMARVGIKLDEALKAGAGRQGCLAYLELHIEQGPVLEEAGYALGTVLGTVGVERNFIRFHGQAAHSGSTPMKSRKDAFLPAGRMAQEIYSIAERHKGVCTIGSCSTKPGIVTSVVEDCAITLDQRHLDAAELAAMWAEARGAARRFAEEARVGVEFGDLWRIEPLPFHPELMELCDEAVTEAAGKCMRLPSGPLHDAAEPCRIGIPTQMIFVQSLKGISHNKIEDTKDEHLELSVAALAALADKTLAWLGKRKARR